MKSFGLSCQDAREQMEEKVKGELANKDSLHVSHLM